MKRHGMESPAFIMLWLKKVDLMGLIQYGSNWFCWVRTVTFGGLVLYDERDHPLHRSQSQEEVSVILQFFYIKQQQKCFWWEMDI